MESVHIFLARTPPYIIFAHICRVAHSSALLSARVCVSDGQRKPEQSFSNAILRQTPDEESSQRRATRTRIGYVVNVCMRAKRASGNNLYVTHLEFC